MPTWNENRSDRPARNGTRRVPDPDDGTPLLREHVAKLESRLKELTESYDVADRYIMPWERFMDGSRLLFPSGFPTDRKGGRDWPVIQTEIDLRQARAFCRLIGQTNPLVITFLDHVTNFVVKTGFKWQVSLRGKGTRRNRVTNDPAVVACQAFLDEFRHLNGWGDDDSFTAGDFDGDDDDTDAPANLEHEGWRRAMRDGEFFLRLFRGGAETNGVPTCRVVEPECVTSPTGDSQGPWSWGILTDPEDRQRRKAYHIVREDGVTGRTVAANRMLHLKLNVDGTIKRGIPDFWPLQDEVQNAQKLWRNTLEVNAILAAIAYIRQHAPGVTGTQVNSMLAQRSTDGQNLLRPQYPYTTADRGTDRTNLYTRSEAGQVIEISNGMQYQPGPSATGTAGQIEALQAIFRVVGIRWGCPEYFSGSAENANFASTLVAGGPFEMACVTRQQHYRRFQGRMIRRVLLLGVESGRLAREAVARVEVKVVPPAVAITNKAEDTQRRSTLNQAKVMSPQTWAMEEGLDPDHEAANFAEVAEKQAQQQQQQPPTGGAGGGNPPGAGGPDGPPPPQPGPGGTDLASLFEGMKRLNEAVGKIVAVREGFAETDHPRDDHGRFVAAGELDAAKTDPAKAQELRDRVTDPTQRAKLDAALDDDPDGLRRNDAEEDIKAAREKEDDRLAAKQERERDRIADQAASRAERWFVRQEADLQKTHDRQTDQLDTKHQREYDGLSAEWNGSGLTGDARTAKEAELTAKQDAEVGQLSARQKSEMDTLHATAGAEQSRVEKEIYDTLAAALDAKHEAEDAAVASKRKAEDDARKGLAVAKESVGGGRDNLIARKVTDADGVTRTRYFSPDDPAGKTGTDGTTTPKTGGQLGISPVDSPPKGANTPAVPNTQPIPVDDREAGAEIAKLPGLSESDRAGLLGAVKGIYAAGAKAVHVAKSVASAVHDEAKLWATRLAAAGITYEDALNDIEEMSNPLKATGAHGTDHVAAATGIPGASWIGLNLVPKIATFAILKAKSLLAGGKKMESVDTPTAVAPVDREELIRQFRAAMSAAIQKALTTPADDGTPDPAAEADRVEESRLLSENFTGRKKDRAGRMRCYQNGKLVPCPDAKAAATPKATAPQPAVAPTPTPVAKKLPAGTTTPTAAVPKKGKRSLGAAPPKLTPAAEAVKASIVLTDASVQRYAEEHVEPQFASRVGGASFPDSEPVDVVVPSDPSHLAHWQATTEAHRQALEAWQAGGKRGKPPKRGDLVGGYGHGIELKTMIYGEGGTISMNAYAQVRKRLWREQHGTAFHTVVIDDRDVFSPTGDHDESKRKYYYRRGIAGSATVSGLHEATGGMDEIRRLMAMPDDQLPDAAKSKEKPWLTRGRWVPLKNGRGYYNPTTKQVVRPKVKKAKTSESVVREDHGPPPWPGAVFDAAAHRWKVPHPDEPPPAVGRMDSPAGGPVPSALAAKWVAGSKVELPDDLKAKYAGTMAAVLARLPAGCRKLAVETLAETGSSVSFHPDIAAVTAACAKASGKRESKVGGFVTSKPGYDFAQMHLDGANESDTAEAIYAHELGHVVDAGHRFSGDIKWVAAYKANVLKGKHLLSRYALLDPAEGFAEFHRYLAKVGVEEANNKYPKCVAFFQSKGLL